MDTKYGFIYFKYRSFYNTIMYSDIFIAIGNVRDISIIWVGVKNIPHIVTSV